MLRRPKKYYQQQFHVSQSTFFRYCKVARLIEEFESDYPSMNPNSPKITDIGITEYQAWVIWMLLQVSKKLKIGNIKRCLMTDSDPVFAAKFSKESFNRRNNTEDEYPGLCTKQAA